MKNEAQLVNAAIAAYQADTQNISAGYDVLRYFQAGLVTFVNVDEPQDTTDVNPKVDVGYAVLALVKAGKAVYNAPSGA